MKFTNIKSIKEYILSNVTEERIFSYYLDIPVSDIIDSINNPSVKIQNKHRSERNPSIRFENNNKLKMIDYGSRAWTGDCFQIAGNILRRDCNNSSDFMIILNDIIENLIKSNIRYIPIDIPVTTKKSELLEISILTRDLVRDDYNYYNSYNIKQSSLINVFAIKNYWLNGVLNKYEYSRYDPCYAYYLGKIKDTILWKLYFPYRKYDRFITNNRICIENIHELTGNRFLIITKSIKDKILLKQILSDLNIQTVDVTNLRSESVTLSDDILDLIKLKYDTAFTLLDNDKAGKDAENIIAARASIYPFFLVGQTHLNYSKDLTDTSKEYGYPHVLELIKHCYINVINK